MPGEEILVPGLRGGAGVERPDGPQRITGSDGGGDEAQSQTTAVQRQDTRGQQQEEEIVVVLASDAGVDEDAVVVEFAHAAFTDRAVF